MADNTNNGESQSKLLKNKELLPLHNIIATMIPYEGMEPKQILELIKLKKNLLNRSTEIKESFNEILRLAEIKEGDKLTLDSPKWKSCESTIQELYEETSKISFNLVLTEEEVLKLVKGQKLDSIELVLNFFTT